MCVLSILLFIIYAIYFRADGGNYANVIKILRGLNSNTFNYLENNKHLLGIDKKIPEKTIVAGSQPSTLEFFSDCVRLNRPCIYRGLASDWPATTKWRDEKKTESHERYAYLETVLDGHTLEANQKAVDGVQFNFKEDYFDRTS